MNFGFVIDQRKCIGCHACTVACKSEHDVPLGVYRTHVKYVEKGAYPDTTRSFSVHRCNHCADAPCTTICPTSALFTRSDGIVDFDNRRCIGCKACMQACPYDALYIDPKTNTAAKCNYCAHRVDHGYEPACVIVCPVEAIVSGDVDDPTSKIARTVAREKVSVRKAEKATVPNVWYVDADHASLTAAAADREAQYAFTDQAKGVGHHAKHHGGDTLLALAMEHARATGQPLDDRAVDRVSQELEREAQFANRRVYDAPSKGVLWGWEVTAYIWTKAVATGALLVGYLPFAIAGTADAIPRGFELTMLLTTLVFMALTGALLVKDLDRPDRFLYVMLRPNWSSWLVRGAYIIAAFCGVVTVMFLAHVVKWRGLIDLLLWPSIALAAATAIYTAFLFAQAKGRDAWQSPLGAVKMLAHAVIAGCAFTALFGAMPTGLFVTACGMHLFVHAIELFSTHASKDAARAVEIMTDKRGRFYPILVQGIVYAGILPIALVVFWPSTAVVAGLFALIGIYLSELVWVRVPQLIPLD